MRLFTALLSSSGGSALPSYVAPTISSIGSANSGTTTVTINMPSHSTDDILFLMAESANQAITTPSGWNALTPYSSGAAGGNIASGLYTFWKRASSSSEPSAVLTGATLDHVYGIAICISGCPTGSSPIVSQSGTSDNSATNPMSFPTLTTTDPNTAILMVAARAQPSGASENWANWEYGDSIPMTERFDSGHSSGNGGGIAFAYGVASTSGAQTAGRSDATVTAGHRSRSVIAFRPSLV